MPATANIAPGRSCSKFATPQPLRGIRHLATSDATFQVPKLRFRAIVVRQAAPDETNLPDFFRSEVIGATEGIAVRDVSFVFTDLKGSTALYERIGDLNAYIQVQRHFQHLLDVTVRHHGAVTKSIGDAAITAVETPADAVRAASDVRCGGSANRDRPQRDFILKIGVHWRASIAVTLNERLDYFGQMANIAARVQILADGDEICIAEDVHDAAGGAKIVAYSVAKGDAKLKGLGKAMSAYHFARRAS